MRKKRERERGRERVEELVSTSSGHDYGMSRHGWNKLQIEKYKEGNKNKRKLDTRRTLEIFPTDTRRQQIVAIVVVVVLL